MPSFDHELFVEMFRDRPELACELLRRCAGQEVPAGDAEVGSIDLSQVVPAEYRADSVTLVRDDLRGVVAAIVVEVQLSFDARKRWTWPVYVTTLRARFECPVTLLVFAPDDAIATWCAESIDTGHPGFHLQPIVVSLSAVPRILEEHVAFAAPELAVLSAIAHRDVAVASLAVRAVSRLPADKGRVYLDRVLAALPTLARRILEENMKGYEYQSDFARKYYGEGVAAGMHEAALAIARAKIPSLSSQQQTSILAVKDTERLKTLVVALGDATTVEQASRLIDELETKQ